MTKLENIFFMVTLAQMVPSTPKSAKYIDLSFYVGMIHCVAEVGETSFSDTDAETETRGSNFSRPGMILRPRKLKFRFRV